MSLQNRRLRLREAVSSKDDLSLNAVRVSCTEECLNDNSNPWCVQECMQRRYWNGYKWGPSRWSRGDACQFRSRPGTFYGSCPDEIDAHDACAGSIYRQEDASANASAAVSSSQAPICGTPYNHQYQPPGDALNPLGVPPAPNFNRPDQAEWQSLTWKEQAASLHKEHSLLPVKNCPTNCSFRGPGERFWDQECLQEPGVTRTAFCYGLAQGDPYIMQRCVDRKSPFNQPKDNYSEYLDKWSDVYSTMQQESTDDGELGSDGALYRDASPAHMALPASPDAWYEMHGRTVYKDPVMFVQPANNEELQLTETQMVYPPIDSTAVEPRFIQPYFDECGGHWTVDKITRKPVRKDWYMGPSQGYPNMASAAYAALNNVWPPQSLNGTFHTY